MYYKLYLISNQFYKNVVEGLTKINYSENAIAFKIRRDIAFDFFIFKSYSYKKENTISLTYERPSPEPSFPSEFDSLVKRSKA